MDFDIKQEIFLGDVKREPSVEYEFTLPAVPDDEQTLDDGGAFQAEKSAPQDEPSPPAEADVAPKLQRSEKSASSSKVFKCDKCSYQTNRKGSLNRHEGKHNKPFKCETCQKKFAISKSLKTHQMQHKHGIYETANETFDCSKCGKWFSTSIYLKVHQRNVHDDEEVQCTVCEKVCKNRKSLRNHSRTLVKVECSFCRIMILKSSMARHVRTHTAETIFECDICGYSCKTKGDLKSHIERAHLLRKLVSDSACCNDFSDFELLENLQRLYGSSATTSEKNFKCDICSRSFMTPNHLNQHKREVHADKTFGCETCKKAFKTKGQLNQHKSSVHSKVRCTICQKKVGQRYLKTHMKFHQPGNHFECDRCGFKTEWKENLSKHINNSHRSGLERTIENRKVLANAKQASSSSLPGGLSDNNPEPVPVPVPLPRASNGPFLLSFVDRIENLPPLVQLHFKRDLKAFIDDFIGQNVE